MELNFTGKGSAFYPPFKNTGAYMLSGKALYLIDCGETMFDVLYHKLDLASIEDVYVILTHMHADHVGSLGTLISYFYCLFNKAIHVVYPQETIKQLLALEGITPLGYHYHETLPENPAGLTAVPVEVKHALDMKCYGYVLSNGTESIYYSGDSSELPEDIRNHLFLPWQARRPGIQTLSLHMSRRRNKPYLPRYQYPRFTESIPLLLRQDGEMDSP